jgi:hypothetical protein
MVEIDCGYFGKNTLSHQKRIASGAPGCWKTSVKGTGHSQGALAVKCVAKETSHTQILASQLPFTSTENNLVTGGLLEKFKRLAVTEMMKPAKDKGPAQISNKHRKPAAVERNLEAWREQVRQEEEKKPHHH